jgi:hypothetical protein
MKDPVEAQRKIWDAVVAKNNQADDVVSVELVENSFHSQSFSHRNSQLQASELNQ